MTRILLLLLILSPLAGFAQDAPSYCGNTTTWNGTSWSNGEPSSDKDVIISAAFTQNGGTFNACSLFINESAVVSFTNNANAIVVHSVTVEGTSTLTFESSSNLIQIENVQNTGNVTIKRKSSKLKKDEYSLWSSPVSGDQSLWNFSPETLANRFYTYSTVDNIYNTVASPDATEFAGAKGYLIRMPETHPVTPTVWEGEFTGVPNTGDINIPMSYVSSVKGYNAVGNPYPSPINITKFIAANSETIEGAIWLWRKTDDAAKSSYATVTKLGYQSNVSADDLIENDLIADPFSIDAEGVLNTGQGFIVKAKNTQDLVFTNDMRMTVNSQNFFRTAQDQEEPAEAEVSRIWINVSNGSNVFTQTLIGYTAEGTLDYDNGYDGESLLDGGVSLYSFAGDRKLAIQARPEFTSSDEVALGFKTQVAGTFEFSLDHTDGLFDNTQDIYIVDSIAGTVHNLLDGAYSFTSETGVFNDRFKVIYTSTLGTENPVMNTNELIVYTNAHQLKITSPEDMESVVVYDMLGRIVFQQGGINSTEFSSSDITAVNQVLIVNIKLNNGQAASRKIMMK